MAPSVEILITGEEARLGDAMLRASSAAAMALGYEVHVNAHYRGDCDWLMLWGVGADARNAARRAQIARGGHAALWDIGYVNAPGKAKEPGSAYVRLSVDENHPWRLLDRTPNDPSRWHALGVALRDDFDPDGPIIVTGMGAKSRVHLGLRNDEWELRMLRQVQARFPQRRVLYRAKPGRTAELDARVDWPRAEGATIEEALRGASLVVCRHSNVAIDACIAGVPVECEDGAAFWLYRHGPNPVLAARLDFLYRMAWWQWRTDEQRGVWTFLQMVCA
jgi:hypothetical protein